MSRGVPARVVARRFVSRSRAARARGRAPTRDATVTIVSLERDALTMDARSSRTSQSAGAAIPKTFVSTAVDAVRRKHAPPHSLARAHAAERASE